MTEKTMQRLHLLYSILLSAMLAMTGVLLITACIGIYASGSKPFTPESVAAAFSGIAIPVYLCVALIMGGFVLDGFFPAKEKKHPIQKQHDTILARLHEKLELRACSAQLQAAIAKAQAGRKLHRLITLILLILGSGLFLSYGANPANFHQSEITASMQKAMYVLLGCMAVPFGYAVFTAYYARKSKEKEILLVKQAMAQTPDAVKAPECTGKSPCSMLPAIRWAILSVSIVILLYGFFAGGTNDVLTKAINICTECVGLG